MVDITLMAMYPLLAHPLLRYIWYHDFEHCGHSLVGEQCVGST
jgi:hypothetical protein